MVAYDDSPVRGRTQTARSSFWKDDAPERMVLSIHDMPDRRFDAVAVDDALVTDLTCFRKGMFEPSERGGLRGEAPATRADRL